MVDVPVRPERGNQKRHASPDVRALHDPTLERTRAHHHGSVGITQDDRSAQTYELVGKVHTRLEHLLVDEHGAMTLCRCNERDRGQIGRKGRPGTVVHLGDRSEGVPLDVVLLGAVHVEVASHDIAPDPEPSESDQRRVEVLDGRPLDVMSLAVTAARPMNDPVSMWSAPIRKCVP